jgi:osomolarity two-component system sensor histidine kinase SLN1
VELVLSGYGSASASPNRPLGDAVIELPDQSLSEALVTGHSSSAPLERPPLLEGRSSVTMAPQASQRPGHLVLPPRKYSLTGFAGAQSPMSSPSSEGNHNTSHPSQSHETDLCVLVVDDDPLTRILMKRMLTRMGCKVETAANGELALEMITGEPRPSPSSLASSSTELQLEEGDASGTLSDVGKYAVVFLDNQMPVMSGLQAVARLRELERRDFVVGITGRLRGSKPEQATQFL